MEKNFYRKLLNVQQKLNAPKNLRNNFGGYNYRSCESILESVKPLLKSEGLILTLSDIVENIGGKNYVRAMACLTDADNPTDSMCTSALAREPESKKGMDDSQITGAASSYARKYALNGLFAIDDNKDADATNTHGKERQAEQHEAQPPVISEQRIMEIASGFGLCSTNEDYQSFWQSLSDAEKHSREVYDLAIKTSTRLQGR